MSEFRLITAICSDLERLSAAPLSDTHAAFRLADEVEAHPEGIQAVPQLLALMEQNSAVDWGTPGPVVHAVERFFGQGYELLLLESVRRVPTAHTLWMLNRLVNGVPAVQRAPYLSAMSEAVTRTNTPGEVRHVAEEFLRIQGEQS